MSILILDFLVTISNYVISLFEIIKWLVPVIYLFVIIPIFHKEEDCVQAEGALH